LAREVLDDRERALIEDALAALAASLAGRYDSSQHFTDLRDTLNDLNDRQ
jgi:hydrogenase expression/formation protein HypC